MADIMSAETRSRLMSRIKGKNTTPEIMLRSALHRQGIRFRIHASGVPGKPDLAWKNRKVAVFVNGCFWHGCPQHFQQPKTRGPFWKEKIEGNRQRDKKVREHLTISGWTVLSFWEHEVIDDLGYCVDRICEALRRNDPRPT